MEPRHQARVVKVLTSQGWRLRGIGKVPETDPVKIAQGKRRKSVRVYARKEPVESAVPFTPANNDSESSGR